MGNPRALAAAVTRRRKERGLTLVQLADQAGLGERTVSQLSAGTHPGEPRATTLADIDRALEWPVGTCLAIYEEREPPDPHGLHPEMLSAIHRRLDQIEDVLADIIAHQLGEERLQSAVRKLSGRDGAVDGDDPLDAT